MQPLYQSNGNSAHLGNGWTNGPSSAAAPLNDIRAWLRALRRRWFVCLVLGLVVGGGGATALWFATPWNYEATALLRVRLQPPYVLQPTRSGDRTYQRTQVELIRLPSVIRGALEAETVRDLPAVRQQEDPEEWLAGLVSTSSSPESEFVRISIEHEDPDVAMLLVNAVVERYLQEVEFFSGPERDRRRQELDEQLNRIERELTEEWEGLQRLAEDLGSGNVESLTQRELMQLEAYREHYRRLRQVHVELWASNRDITRARSALGLPIEGADEATSEGEPSVEVPEGTIDELVEQDQQVIALQDQILQLEHEIVQYEQLGASDSDPQLVQLRRQREQTEERLASLRTELRPVYSTRARQILLAQLRRQLQEVEARQANLRAEEGYLNQQLDELSRDLERASGGRSIELEQRRAEIERLTMLSDSLWNSRERLDIERRADPGVELLAPAERPRTRDESRRKKMAMLGGVAGFGGTVLLIGFLQLRARRVSMPDDVGRHAGLTVIGTVPTVPHEARRVQAGARRGERVQRWYWAFRESVDTVAAHLMYSPSDRRPQCAMITSATSGEGKSTLATHLAVSLARARKKTILIDGDMRRPTLHRVFEADSSPGLSEVIEGKADAADAIVQTHLEHLDFLSAGRIPFDPQTVLTAPALRSLMDELRQRYDFILIDTPPVLAAVDALLVGQHADTTLISIVSDVSQYHRVRSAAERLHGVGIAVFGAVVIGTQSEAYPHYEYYGHGNGKQLAEAPATASADDAGAQDDDLVPTDE